MAMETIPAHAITQFSDMMHVRAQQAKSRLRPWVEIVKLEGESFAYDGLGTVEAREVTTRYAQVVFDDIEHNRRKLIGREFTVTLPISESDMEVRLTDPKGKYAEACVKAMERVFDRVVYDAMFADVATGQSFGTTVTFANDGGSTVNATGGLTLAKLLEAQAGFIDDDVTTGEEDAMDLAMGITGDEHSTLLQIATLTSRDYSSQFQLEKGRLLYAVGINMLRFGANATNPILSVASTVRTSFVTSRGAMCVGLQRPWKMKLQERTDLENTHQVKISGRLGAVRTEGKLIKKFTVTDA